MKSTQIDINHLLNAVDSEMTMGSEKGDPTEKQLSVRLEDRELWQKFKEYTNEMIVTKNGRRMFPVFRVSVSGLDPNAMYTFLLDFVQVDNHRWKYVNGDWVAGGKAEPAAPNCVYIHPDSPNFGAHWMKDTLTFSKVKLTNKLNGGGQIMLNSLHKYEPRLHIVRVNSRTQKKNIMTFSFPDTQFIAVTAYQNEEITSLKIKHNPFAKAFLDAKERPEHREFSVDDPTDPSRAPFSHLASTWFLPPGGPTMLPPPAHHQFANAFNLANGHCDRLSSLSRHQRSTPHYHPYQRRSPPTGSFSREVGPNIPMLNIADNWTSHMSSGGAGFMAANPVTNTPAPQYGMWMGSNLTHNQGCAMPYLRSPAAYQLPTTLSTSMVNSSPSLKTEITSVTSPITSLSQATYDHPCDFTSYVSAGMNASRDISRSNWSPLTPPPL